MSSNGSNPPNTMALDNGLLKYLSTNLSIGISMSGELASAPF